MVAADLARPSDVQGCTPEELAEVEAQAGFPLPAMYRAFLRAMGRKAGMLLVGTDVFYPRPLELRGMAEELLAECQSPLSLPREAFVFAMHQGYRFLYFVARPGDDDPAVYSYLEGESGSKLVATRFSEFLRDVIERSSRTGGLRQ